MADHLGDKIKTLRKEMKLTQTDLAGGEMTKSMLSQIENNTATPSMKNLLYLASRLGKPVSYFIDNEPAQDFSSWKEIQEEMKIAAGYYSDYKFAEAAGKLEEIEKKYTFDKTSKLYADFLSKYGEYLIDVNKPEEARKKIGEAVAIYRNKYLMVDAAKTYLVLMGIPWNKFDYEKCLIILSEAERIYKDSIIKDYAFEIEILYNKSIFLVTLEKMEEGIAASKEALEISRRTKIYYRTDELYKNLATMTIMQENYENFDFYMKKAAQYAQFTENSLVLSSLELIYGMYYIHRNEPLKALEHQKKASEIPDKLSPLIYSQLAQTYYLLADYDKALDCVKKVQIPDYVPSKFDYLLIYSSKTYEGLSLFCQGKKKEALEALKQGIEKMETVGISKELARAYRAIGDIYSDIGEYKKAFQALKKSNEIEETAKTDKLYY